MNTDYDIVITGRHLATGLLAAILARNGVRTALIPTQADRDIPAGETTVPYTAELFFLLGSRFGVPAIGAMGMYSGLPDWLRTRCRQKRNLGFLYHRPGTRQQPAEALQFNVPAEHAEWHLYRPAVDAYAAEIAAANGAAVLAANAVPGGVRPGTDQITVELADDEVVTAQYLVDGSADTGLLPAGATGPRTGKARHRNQLLTACLSAVPPFESLVARRPYGKASPWSAGTLLHVFDGGWAQVVPFTGGSASVTVSVDQAGPDAKTRFSELAERFPDLRRHLGDAPVERDWTAYPDWPAWTDQGAGPRWFLFDRAAGRHDFLLSRDVTMSLELVHATASGLLRLAASGDWAGDGMQEIATFQRGLFDFHDRFVAAGRIATGHFPLWNAYLRVWLLWSILSALSLKRARLDAEATGEWALAERYAQVPYWYQVPAGLAELVADALDGIESVARGAEPEAVAGRIFARLSTEPCVPPLYQFGDPAARYYSFTRARRLRMLMWAKTTAPADFRRLLTADNVTAVPRTGTA
jgi:tetracycline 7-halogenase / FADH2 O2-dependent halogenase